METKNEKIRILIVDDEADIRDILQFNLENEGFDVDLAVSAEEALTILTDSHSLILLDVMMGGISGFRMAERLRKEGRSVPIIFLTARDTENDMLTAFSTGADDYISKPFSIKEVIARVKSVVKRTYHSPVVSSPKTIINIKTLVLNLETKELTIDNQNVALTKTEFNILVLLVKNEPKVFSREDILDKVWPDGEIVLERTVDVHIARLRKKIGEYGNCILNRTGYGYSFNSDKVE